MKTPFPASDTMKAIRFYVYSGATSIIIGTQTCAFALQSSVQASHGAGSLSLAVYQICTIVSALFIYPLLLRFMGRKYNLLLGDIGCVIIGLTLLVPSQYGDLRYVPIIVNGFTGILSCSLWSAAFATSVSLSSTNTDVNSTAVQSGTGNVGCFIAILSFGQSLINILPEVTLRDFVTQTVSKQGANLTIIYSCGAEDCPHEYSTNVDHPIYEKLVPVISSLYIFVGVLVILQIGVVIVHWVLVPNDQHTNEETRLLAEQNERDNAAQTSIQITLVLFKDSITKMWQNLTSAANSFTFLSQIHLGVISGFVWLAFTRSFISCTFGVQKVGFLMLIFYVMSAFASFLAAKCLNGIRLRLLTVAKSVLDVMTCTLAIVWIPSLETVYILYVLAALFGICQGLSKSLAYALPVIYCKDIDSGYTLCLCWDATGVALCSILSATVCTLYILYVVILSSVISSAVLVFGTCFYAKQRA